MFLFPTICLTPIHVEAGLEPTSSHRKSRCVARAHTLAPYGRALYGRREIYDFLTCSLKPRPPCDEKVAAETSAFRGERRRLFSNDVINRRRARHKRVNIGTFERPRGRRLSQPQVAAIRNAVSAQTKGFCHLEQ